jgi:hypothetical protein
VVKSVLRKTLSRIVRNDWWWSFLNATLIRATRAAEWERGREERAARSARMHGIVSRISPDLRVKHGVFKGLRYPARAAVGSQLAPKLLGSYEKEIQDLVERICSTPYTDVVNIGCAEGYYAVGLAMRIPNATVHAYDLNEEAIRLCSEMAALNGVSSRVIMGAFCDAERLKSIRFSGKALIISDCEGYEKQLFTEEIASFLAPHDVLLEIHDFIDIEISSHIRRVFAATHDIEVLQSVDDIRKAQDYAYPELEGLDLSTRKEVLAECRPAAMEWFFMKTRMPAVAAREIASGSR